VIELAVLFGIIIGFSVLLAWLDSPLSNAARYRGRTFDPQRPVIRRAGVVRGNGIGRVCATCGAMTYGWSGRCGKCQ
jgi:hypothetical protein